MNERNIMMIGPEVVMSLDSKRNITSGSIQELNKKIRNGSDLRISTGFIYNEHIDIGSGDGQLIEETSTFAETLLVDNVWSAGFMTLRQPVSLKDGLFGYPNSLSLFMYNQDGQQALARLVLDGSVDRSVSGDSEKSGIPRMITTGIYDEGTQCVSKNFIYDFEFFDYMTDDCYEELYSNSGTGAGSFGSIDELAEAYRAGRGIKIAISGISDIVWGYTGHTDEIYLHCGSSYYLTCGRIMTANTLPFVSVPADIPLQYRSKSCRYCWAVAQTNGMTEIRCYDPYDDTWDTKEARLAVRWFAKK